MNVRNILRSESTWTSAVIILAAMMVFMRSVSHILIGDELRYCYKFELKPGQNYFNFNNLKPVKTVSDVVDSQINHYECVNGRIPVHFTEQTIAATKGIRVFYVINAIAFAAMLLLFIRVTLPRRLQWNPLAALIAAIALLYLFPTPGRLWMSVNLSLNYMWPALASLSVIYCLQKITTTEWKPSATANAGLIILGFLTGWSNEAFAFPLSAAIFLYFILNIRQFDRRARMLVIPLWTGALIMLLSPGNWIRATQATAFISSFFDILFELKIIWILTATAIISAIADTKPTITFIRRNYVVITALTVSIAMGVIAHTAARAFTAIEMFSAILLMRAAAPLIKPMTRRGWIIFISLLALFTAHQTLTTIEHRRHHAAIRDALKEYRESATGTVLYDYHKSPFWLAPFVYSQVPTPNGADYEWRLLGISQCGLSKPFIALSPDQHYNLDTIQSAAPVSSPLCPFIKIDGGYFTPYDSTVVKRYKITNHDGRQMSVSRRIFVSPKGRAFAMLIPPAEDMEFIRIQAQ